MVVDMMLGRVKGLGEGRPSRGGRRDRERGLIEEGGNGAESRRDADSGNGDGGASDGTVPRGSGPGEDPRVVTTVEGSFGGSEELLVAQHLSKRYGHRQAVDDASVRVGRGEFVALLGPSGSGKTTILNMVAGFVSPSGGDIHFEGRSILRIPAHRRGFGVVFQSYALFPHMTVRENVAFGLKMRRVHGEEAERRTKGALELMGLSTYGESRPRELSGGQQQRVALARALVIQPKLLLMDEPLAALDRRMRDRLQRHIRDLHKQLGVAVLYVTHDQAEAFGLADRIAVMDQGHVIQVGTAEELYERPNSLFVANFVGDSNAFPVTVGDGVFLIGSSHHALPRACAGPIEGPLSVGGKAQLVVRPERVVLYDGGDAPSARPAWALPGVVRRATYLGPDGVVGVETVALDRVVEARLSSSRVAEVKVGDEVYIGWDPASCMVVPESG